MSVIEEYYFFNFFDCIILKFLIGDFVMYFRFKFLWDLLGLMYDKLL